MTSTALPAADAALFVARARDVEACLDQHIPPDRPVALLQFPFDGNVGNHMMWLAVSNYLEARGIRTAYAAHQWNFNLADMRRAVGDGTILFTGGVTVSRLWPGHAQIKRVVAEACPNNRLISLPSTMLFVDDDDRREASTIFGAHRDSILMARDPVSAAAARGIFPANVSIVTIHDSAFLLPQQPRNPSAAEHDVIWLARDDLEGAGFAVPDDVSVFDWPQRLDGAGLRQMFWGRMASRVRRVAPVVGALANPTISKSYQAVSRAVVAGGNTTLDRGKVLVTDRMHPHVLAALRGQTCVLLPDLFGKNRAVFEYSSQNFSTIHWADTPAEALETARALAAEN